MKFIKNSDFVRSRALFARWAGWFSFVNLLILLFIGINYLRMLPDFHASYATMGGIIFAYIFLVISFIGHFSLTVFGQYVILLIIALIFPRRWFIFLFAILLSAAVALFFFIDSVVFNLYHLHLVGVVWQLFRLGVMNEVLALSWLEWTIGFCAAIFLVMIETGIAFFVWYQIRKRKKKGLGLIISAILAFLVFASYAIFSKALSIRPKEGQFLSNVHLLQIDTQFIPYYQELYSLILSIKDSHLYIELGGAGFFFQAPKLNKPLHYPLSKITCQPLKKPYNIVFIILDAWRFDAFNSSVTPNIYRFSKKSLNFTEHLSGGNATGPGIFTLFYSLPYTYWSSILEKKRGPVFIDELQKQGYQMGIFRSASLHYPAFDETVFSQVKDLKIKTPGKYAYQKDKKITENVLAFLQQVDRKKPFFSFLFYDTSHNYCEKPSGYPTPFEPSTKICNRALLTKNSDRPPFFNMYKNALHYVDNLVGEVLDSLSNNQFLNDTVIIITADHGEQFNDNEKSLWGHASDYTQWQLHIPLLIYIPGSRPRTIDYFNSSFDVMPFLMQRFLGCNTPIKDYSVGAPLLQAGGRPYILAGSYVDYALIEMDKDRIIRIYPAGDVRVYNNKNENFPHASMSAESARALFQLMNQFFETDQQQKDHSVTEVTETE